MVYYRVFKGARGKRCFGFKKYSEVIDFLKTHGQDKPVHIVKESMWICKIEEPKGEKNAKTEIPTVV